MKLRHMAAGATALALMTSSAMAEKVLRIQSDQMRVRRRQMAEEEAHRAPIKMIFPIALLIFPSILLVLLGPAALMLVTSPSMRSVFGG